MSTVYALVGLYGLLTWLLLVCEAREERERDQAGQESDEAVR
ncbi:hypothetical protein PBI_IRONMAN_62 [Mycobacterium phage IronMan]|uniref:Uncharacterized protein n=1 Tax=Mycobacterium phage IronMan TaxID=2499042 RepID=A0A3S9UD82_9CAUD|nr:hypothetical protein KI247_gp39 [Mycobacterium phage IronMan]AZS08263.1 hypothetical protein PBI_IRONMAN_62 [Mycobacterium phage IronMan]